MELLLRMFTKKAFRGCLLCALESWLSSSSMVSYLVGWLVSLWFGFSFYCSVRLCCWCCLSNWLQHTNTHTYASSSSSSSLKQTLTQTQPQLFSSSLNNHFFFLFSSSRKQSFGKLFRSFISYFYLFLWNFIKFIVFILVEFDSTKH